MYSNVFIRKMCLVLFSFCLVAVVGCEEDSGFGGAMPDVDEETIISHEETGEEIGIEESGGTADVEPAGTQKEVLDSACNDLEPIVIRMGDQSCSQNSRCKIKIKAGGGSGSLQFTATGLPAGLSIVDGEMVGRPTHIGVSTVNLTVSDVECPIYFEKASFAFEITEYTGEEPKPEEQRSEGRKQSEEEKPAFDENAKLFVTIRTADVKNAATSSANLNFRMCKKFDQLWGTVPEDSCSTMSLNGAPGRGSSKEYSLGQCKLDNDEECDYSKLDNYLVHNGVTDGWLVQSLKVVIKQGGESRVLYWNPCIFRWYERYDPDDTPYGDSFKLGKFSKNDTAACAVLKTGNVKKAGTSDRVLFVFSEPFGSDGSTYKYFDVDGHDDNEKGQSDVSGFLWRGNKFEDRPRRFYVNKEKGKKGGDGGWYLDYVKLYLFRPGRSFVDDPKHPKSFYIATYDFENWLTNDKGLRCPRSGWIDLHEVNVLPSAFGDLGEICN